MKDYKIVPLTEEDAELLSDKLGEFTGSKIDFEDCCEDELVVYKIEDEVDYEVKFHSLDDFAILMPKDGNGIQLSINKITSEKAKRHHMDLFAEDQQAEVKRLLALGATLKKWDYPAGADYVVPQDPDGNPFCVVQI